MRALWAAVDAGLAEPAELPVPERRNVQAARELTAVARREITARRRPPMKTARGGAASRTSRSCDKRAAEQAAAADERSEARSMLIAAGIPEACAEAWLTDTGLPRPGAVPWHPWPNRRPRYGGSCRAQPAHPDEPQGWPPRRRRTPTALTTANHSAASYLASSPLPTDYRDHDEPGGTGDGRGRPRVSVAMTFPPGCWYSTFRSTVRRQRHGCAPRLPANRCGCRCARWTANGRPLPAPRCSSARTPQSSRRQPTNWAHAAPYRVHGRDPDHRGARSPGGALREGLVDERSRRCRRRRSRRGGASALRGERGDALAIRHGDLRRPPRSTRSGRIGGRRHGEPVGAATRPVPATRHPRSTKRSY